MDYRRVPDNGGRVTGRGSCTISGVTTSAETRPSSIDPLWVAEQKSSFSATRKGSRPNAFAYTSVFGTTCLDRCLWNGHPCGCHHVIYLLAPP